MPQEIELTERLLNDAGGWQVMKQARALYDMGRVLAATWQPPLLEGRVREGEKEYRSGLRIVSRTNIENLCGCRDSRQRGVICAHSVAIGLEALKPRASAGEGAKEQGTNATLARLSPEKTPPPAPKNAGPELALDAGEPAFFHVILPPNLAASWEKGSCTVVFEAEIGGKRAPLNALPKTRRFRVGPEDLALAAQLRLWAEGTLPGMVMLKRSPFLTLLGALREHPRVTFGRSQAMAILNEPHRPPLEIRKENGLALKAILPKESKLLTEPGAQSWLLIGASFQEVAPGLSPAYALLLQKEVQIPPEAGDQFLRRELPRLRDAFVFEEPDLPEEVAQVPAHVEIAIFLEGSLNHFTARLRARYGDRAPFTLTAPSAQNGRDPAAENALIERLVSSGFSGPDSKGEFILKTEPKILAFFAQGLPWWERHAKVEIGSRFSHVTRNVERVQPSLEVRSSGQDWFELQVELATAGGERFSAAEIQRLLQSGQSHVRRNNGKIAVFDPGLLDEFQQVLQDCDPKQKQPGLYQIDHRHAAYLTAAAQENGAALKAPENWYSWSSGARELEQMEAVALGTLEEVLRPYQKQGVYWLNFLARNSLGGILADEMGLGKTLQALAAARALGGKSLVVCPSSLIYNWQREAERFTPDRRVLAIEGPNRHGLFGEPFRSADLVVTSYPLLRRDIDRYRGVEFTTAILDEAQHIKNPESQNAQSAFAIRARHRFVLTGTPVENSVRDVWSLMNFAMPGYLGARNDFKERFEGPITAQPGGPENQRLVKRLRPFVLRRLKKTVASELPEKLEQIAFCELTEAQQAAYSELLGAARRQVSEYAGTKDQGKARMVMLTALLRLRQTCCDLRLLGLDPDDSADSKPSDDDEKPVGRSAKVALLSELLQEAVDGGHRVLVFSQFAKMLGLLRESLAALGMDYCHLDGATRDRSNQVDRFQRGDAPVFLISLKAGGVGLNLTAADTVIHFDPWWNPAVEAQATDRAHRIGQKNVVTVYKLIARGTVEEKILALQTKKRQVIDATIESEQPMMQGLTMSDIEGLLT